VLFAVEFGISVEGLDPVTPVYTGRGMVAGTILRFSFDVTPEGKLTNCVITEAPEDADSSICASLNRRYDVTGLPPATRKATGWVAFSTGPFDGPLPPVPPTPPVVVVPAPATTRP